VAFEELAVRLGLALHQVGEAGHDGIDLVVKGLVVAPLGILEQRGEPIEGGSLGGAWDLDGALGHVRGIPARAPVRCKGPPREVALRTKRGSERAWD
jgi:hypothetical protein